ncbi:alpha-amylase family glycosyl hydrolase [Aquisalinus flavus]|uniref:Alpha-amylase n=1 Tax=Aquisalinus flavus TaxID=1526572 RepID=A0A8J2V267_9PROT|nr:alpha-amylase family glycosyl hydrolase [Aquisalinus flavus]MBD0427070.1 alpha-amylase [Aquisalinus flavus]UNE46895.1 alpha-amylase [Aquisalinus flavus]GGC98139.1 alpha-amylase [Aquisalinus flavus]
MRFLPYTAIALMSLAPAPLTVALPAAAENIQPWQERLPQDEIIYFVLPDRFENADPSNDEGGLSGGRLATGFDPTHKGMFHGGDLKGLTARLDYIEGLGATAIWLGPIYKNKVVQGPPGQESAGYHGYWITDFTQIDPHFGTNDDMKALVDAAHARGMKVYLDIIVNHTADVIQYRECHDPDFAGEREPDSFCPYRDKATYPFTTRGLADGAAINDGFMGDQPPWQMAENFERLTDQTFAYTPFVPDSEKDIKVPAWLNDLSVYHNRGNSYFSGESSLYGDFFGLDDLNTEDPRVVAGMIEIFSWWISEFDIDGYRVDTARHVAPEFWHAFIPAILDHAAKEGKPNFHIFGEVALHTPGELAVYTRRDGYPAVLDFGFQQAVRDVLADGKAPLAFADLFMQDALYKHGPDTALQLPVFTGNHDMGRFGRFLSESLPQASEEELLARLKLGHAMMFFARGVPTIYYGDEQGFTGDDGDQDAREDMFPSRVEIYNDNNLIGTDATTAIGNFDTTHPLYRATAGMAALHQAHPALRRGAQVLRLAESEPGGLLALSRLDAETGAEYLVTFNTGTNARTRQVEVDPASNNWTSLSGTCAPASTTTASYRVTVPPLDYTICVSGKN